MKTCSQYGTVAYYMARATAARSRAACVPDEIDRTVFCQLAALWERMGRLEGQSDSWLQRSSVGAKPQSANENGAAPTSRAGHG